MGQRVRVQYTVDLDNYENEVVRLLAGAIEQLQELQLTINKDNILTLESAQQIDNLRRALAGVDFTLADVYGLINGYVGFKTSQHDEAPDRPPLSPSLEQKVEAFREEVDSTE
tara:strand:+ start:1570 stop:1908 length:339 start_codon:yes stop_codon:yes gene_type:complete